MHRISFVMILLLLATNLRADAQEQGTDARIVAAVAAHFAEALADTTIAADPRIAARAHRSAAGTFEGEWSSDVIEVLRTTLDARIVRQADVVRCQPERPGTCRISGADVFIKFGRPQVADGSAIVYVDIMFRSASTRTPVAGRQHEVVLKAAGSGWQVVSARIVAQS